MLEAPAARPALIVRKRVTRPRPPFGASPRAITLLGDRLLVTSRRDDRKPWSHIHFSTSGIFSTGDTGGWVVHSLGQLRDAVSGVNDTLWLMSNNTDGRGARATDDDDTSRVQVAA